MEVYTLLWYFALAWSITLVQGKDGCKDLKYLDCTQNKTLTGHVIKKSRVIVPGLPTCQNNCYHEDQCVSYNLGPVDGHSRMCELSAADHWTRPSFLVSKDGFEYCPIENPCSSNPCPANRLCKPDFAWDTYNCNDGGWTQWSIWSGCSHTSCPRIRKRSCTNPAPQKNGAKCRGAEQETKKCGKSSIKSLKGCESPLGMEDKRIKDQQISASSFYDNLLAPSEGRLNNQYVSSSSTGSWSARSRSAGEWLQVDLLQETIITKVATQRRFYVNQWVTKYAVAFSNDNIIWSEGDCVKTYVGNSGQNTIVTNKLEEPIRARYIRLTVQEFYGWPSIRMELYGCTP